MYSKIVCIASTVLLVASLNAQSIDDRAKNSAERKANNRVDNRIDQGIDKGLDAFEGLFKKKNKKNKSTEEEATTTQSQNSQEAKTEPSTTQESPSQANAQTSNMLQGLFAKVDWESSYRFDMKSTVLITTTNKRGKSESNTMRWMVGEDAMGMEMEEDKKGQSPGLIIFDYVNKAFITLTENEGEKTGMAIAMNLEQIGAMSQETIEEQSNIDGTFKRAGKTKTILGYTCQQYTYTDGESSGEMWMAEDVPSHMAQMARMMGGTKGSPEGLPENYPKGNVMEMNSVDAKSGESMTYLVTEIDASGDIVFDLAPYNVMDMATMMQMGGK